MHSTILKMKTKRTDKEVLAKGLKKMGFALVLLFLGPTVVYIAFSNQEKLLYYPLLILGIFMCTLAIFMLFKGINTIMDSMFKSNKTS